MESFCAFLRAVKGRVPKNCALESYLVRNGDSATPPPPTRTLHGWALWVGTKVRSCGSLVACCPYGDCGTQQGWPPWSTEHRSRNQKGMGLIPSMDVSVEAGGDSCASRASLLGKIAKLNRLPHCTDNTRATWR